MKNYWFCTACNRYAYFEQIEANDGEPALRCGKCGHVAVIPDQYRSDS